MDVFAQAQPQRRVVYVVSDLHLGGAPPAKSDGDNADPNPGFQMCPSRSRAALARFIRWIAEQHAANPGEAELVINGDFVDFLAECTTEGFSAFTREPELAVQKLEQAIAHMDDGWPEEQRVFAALRAFTAAGCRLAVVLGNHDLEFALPAVRERLCHELTGGQPAHLRLYFDGEALRIGNLLIEHGNRYDAWNWVNHRALRELRAQRSRSELEVDFVPPPGSQLVQRVMNPLKARYAFIDLLKPENQATLPLLAALEPDCIGQIKEVAAVARRVPVAARALGTGTAPRSTKISAGGAKVAPRERPTGEEGRATEPNLEEALPRHNTDEVLERLHHRWKQDPARSGQTRISTRDWLRSARSLWQILSGESHEERLERLQEALRENQHDLEAPFAVGLECEPYHTHAVRLADEQPRVVVFGHTHLPKRVPLPNGGLYLNTGTWCPTLRLPDLIYRSNAPKGEVQGLLETFVDDVKHNRLGPWLAFHFTFARVELDLASGEAKSAALCEFLPDEEPPFREVRTEEHLPHAPEIGWTR